MPDAHLTWRAIDATARGPEGPMVVSAGGKFHWGRNWNTPTATKALSQMPPGLSSTAIYLIGDANRGFLYLATQQGKIGGSGHLQVFPAGGGPALHRLSASSVDHVRLGSGNYRLVLSLDDPYCEVHVSYDAGQPPRVPPPRGRGVETGLWPLQEYFEVPTTRHAEFAVSLLAMAATHFHDLRGPHRTPHDYFVSLLKVVLGKNAGFGGRQLKKSVQRLRLTVPKGSVKLTEVGKYRFSQLNQEQRDAVRSHLAAMGA